MSLFVSYSLSSSYSISICGPRFICFFLRVSPFEELAEELHKPVRRKFTRRKVKVFGIHVGDIWGADLVDIKEWSRVNKQYNYMLNVIDIYSKFAWSVPIKD